MFKNKKKILLSNDVLKVLKNEVSNKWHKNHSLSFSSGATVQFLGKFKHVICFNIILLFSDISD